MSLGVCPQPGTFDGYANDDLERSIDITFAPAMHDSMKRLGGELQMIASHFGQNAPDIRTPEKGFLTERLSSQQEKVLNAVLWPQYAQRYALEQSALLATPIVESRERMADLFKVLQQRDAWFTYSQEPLHPACEHEGMYERVMWVRSDVAHSIAAVFRALNDIGLMGHLEFCWRPPEVQKGLFFRRVIDVARRNVKWPWERVRTVASSLTAPAPGFAGHQAGAAVDWTLRERSPDVGKQPFLDGGIIYPEGGAVSNEHFPYLTFDQFRTRLIFLFCAEMGRLKTLPTETWHISRGDRGMAEGRTPVRQAIYGPIREFDRTSGEVEPYDTADIDRWFFSDEEIRVLIEQSRRGSESGHFALNFEQLFQTMRQLQAQEGSR